MIGIKQRELIQSLWINGPLSRWELHERTGLSPNRVGTLADSMIRSGLVRECAPAAQRTGRPRVPLEIDPSGRHLVGLAFAPGGFTLCRLGLTGVLIEQIATPAVSNPAKLIDSAAAMLAKVVNARTLSIGVTFTGFLDPSTRKILLSSALPGLTAVSLAPIYEAAGDRPIVLGNDMHALAARWLLLHRAEQQQDVLLVWFADGRFGSVILIDGRPNRGCYTGGNELGHTRFFVDTEPCFCGQSGCLERIVSTDFLLRQDRLHGKDTAGMTLQERVTRFQPGKDASMNVMLDYLCGALSNAVNFVRPNRLVLVSTLVRHTAFAETLAAGTRAKFLPAMADAVHLDVWNNPAAETAENAAWLATAELFWTGWDAAQSSAEKDLAS